MSTVPHNAPPAAITLEQLSRMVGPDPHRPGVARGRLIAESIAVWALIGLMRALAGTRTPDITDQRLIELVADDYAISDVAVQAAVLYYLKHRPDIDALLDENAAEFA